MSELILVGLSGGVDSSVSAHLLRESGYRVEGVFMKNWEGDDDEQHCPAAQDLADAQAVADKLDIPLHTVNFAKDYWDRVFTFFLDEYQAGRTPNPDILCNREIKFSAFLDYALEQGASKIATGHYARIKFNKTHAQLAKGRDRNKDQSYFLHALNQHQLNHSLFPLGTLTKPEVRQLAKDLGLINYNKKDSTGICFIGERKFRAFLKEYLLTQPGEIITPQGEIISTHQGLMYYTIGQRDGLNIGGLKNRPARPWFVVDKNIDKNQLIVAQGNDHPLLYYQGLKANKPHWIAGSPPDFPLQCFAKIRYRQADQPCLVTADTHGLLILFDTPQRAVTPGQSIVFYDQNICSGGAVITAGIR